MNAGPRPFRRNATWLFVPILLAIHTGSVGASPQEPPPSDAKITKIEVPKEPSWAWLTQLREQYKFPKGILYFPLWFSTAEGFGSLWVAESKRKGSTIRRGDLKTLEVTARIPVSGDVTSILIAKGSVWAFSEESGRIVRLHRVDPETNQIRSSVAVDKGLGAVYMAEGEGSAWAIQNDGILRRLELESGRLLAEIRVGPSHEGWFTQERYSGITFAEGAVWISEWKEERSNLIKVDPKTNQVVATISVGSFAMNPAVGGGFLWVSAYDDVYYIWKIDLRTHQVVDKIFLPSTPTGLLGRLPRQKGFSADLAAGEDGIWVFGSPASTKYLWRISY
jgi:hypothetical protein